MECGKHGDPKSEPTNGFIKSFRSAFVFVWFRFHSVRAICIRWMRHTTHMSSFSSMCAHHDGIPSNWEKSDQVTTKTYKAYEIESVTSYDSNFSVKLALSTMCIEIVLCKQICVCRLVGVLVFLCDGLIRKKNKFHRKQIFPTFVFIAKLEQKEIRFQVNHFGYKQVQKLWKE